MTHNSNVAGGFCPTKGRGDGLPVGDSGGAPRREPKNNGENWQNSGRSARELLVEAGWDYRYTYELMS